MILNVRLNFSFKIIKYEFPKVSYRMILIKLEEVQIIRIWFRSDRVIWKIHFLFFVLSCLFWLQNICVALIKIFLEYIQFLSIQKSISNAIALIVLWYFQTQFFTKASIYSGSQSKHFSSGTLQHSKYKIKQKGNEWIGVS